MELASLPIRVGDVQTPQCMPYMNFCSMAASRRQHRTIMFSDEPRPLIFEAETLQLKDCLEQ